MRQVRGVAGLTLKQVCERMADHGVDLTEAGLSNIENGNKRASDRVLIAWSRALGIEQLDVWHGPLRKPVQAGPPSRRQPKAAVA